jgi:hypothetical protein
LSKLLLILLLSPALALAQHGALEITGDEDYPFKLYVNGLEENETPMTKVTVHRLSAGEHRLRLVFQKRGMQSPQHKIDIAPNRKTNLEVIFKDTKRGMSVKIEEKDDEAYIVPPADTAKILISPSSEPPPIVFSSSDKAQDVFDKQISKQTSQGGDNEQTIPVDSIGTDSFVVVKKGCGRLIPPKAFELILEKIFAEAYEEERLLQARTLATENCLTAIQIMEIVQQFEFENSRLDLAKFAFDYCFDPENYHFVEDAFEYELSKKKLSDFLIDQRK